jgi:hypothetical protein
MACVGLGNSCSWRHDWKEHVFHKAIHSAPAVQGGRGRTAMVAVWYGGIAVGNGGVIGDCVGGGGEEAIW